MRIGRLGFVILVLLTSLSTVGDGKVARARANLRTLEIEQGPPPPPPPRFIAFRSLERRIEMREDEELIVGEMAADCAPGLNSVFVVSSRDTPFVTLSDDSCPTSGKYRSLIRVAPQRGDTGKYRVVVCGNACNGIATSCFSFDIKVKQAL